MKNNIYWIRHVRRTAVVAKRTHLAPVNSFTRLRGPVYRRPAVNRTALETLRRLGRRSAVSTRRYSQSVWWRPRRLYDVYRHSSAVGSAKKKIAKIDFVRRRFRTVQTTTPSSIPTPMRRCRVGNYETAKRLEGTEEKKSIPCLRGPEKS